MKNMASLVCRITLLVGVGGALGLGCSSGGLPDEALGETRELIVVGQHTLTLTLPRGVSPADVGLAATRSLRIDDRAQVNGPSGALATVANTGSSGTQVGVDARAGNLWSASQVTLRDRAQISGFISTAANVVRGNSVTVAGPITQGATLTPSNVVNVAVTVPTSNASSRTIENGQSFTPSAQAYESLTVRSNGTLTLRTGTYYLGSLVVDP